jgi:hypothetical protein
VVLARLAGTLIASVLDLRDEIAAEVAKHRPAETAGTPHRYDPASTTDCIAERSPQWDEREASARIGFNKP